MLGDDMTPEREPARRRLNTDEKQEIVDEVYARFYLQVGRSAIRTALYVFWAAFAYLAYYLASKGVLK
jgi:hypothetical protein